jgi:calcineurin-like phosphoesterase family protein
MVLKMVKRSIPSLKWSVFWIIIHSFSVFILALLLAGLSNEILYLIFTGFGITVIARTVRMITRHKPFFDNSFLLWTGFSIISFGIVRYVLNFFQIFEGFAYFILMGTGIYLISQLILKFPIKKSFKPTFKQKRNIFLISDTHFNHHRIIGYCHRPFRSVRSMNNAMRYRWNHTVRRNDQVFFLGDFVIHGSIGYWKLRLNGRKTFIRGNHDYKMKNVIHHAKFRYQGIWFYLVHDPFHAPKDWDGWIIYGHKHNHNLEIYPFIDGIRKRINVSAEVIDYRPISLDYLISLNLPAIRKKKTIRSQTEYW